MKARISIMACLLAAFAIARAAEEECPLKWYSLKEGLAEAKSRNRPIVLILTQGSSRGHDWFESSTKTKEGKRVWRCLAPLEDANVVLIRVPPPSKLTMASGASAQQVALLQKAHRTLMERYRKLTTKYGVARIPTVLFLSPDGETLFRSYSRQSEGTVLDALKHMHHYFRHHQQAKALMEKKPDPGTGAAVDFGPADARAKYYTSMPQAIAAAKTADAPVVAVFTQTGSGALDWFGYRLGLEGALEWSDYAELKSSGAVLVKIAPPTPMKLGYGAPYTEVGKLRDALKKMGTDYGELAKKYGIQRLPAVRFLSPDGSTVLKSYDRQPSKVVVAGLKNMKKTFDDYKQIRAALKEAGEDEDKTKKKPGDGKTRPKNDF